MTDPQTVDHRQRNSRIFARDQNDFYVEPSWCSERLFDEEQFRGGILDPACGGGNILKSAWFANHLAVGFDVVERTPIVARAVPPEFRNGAGLCHMPIIQDWLTYDGPAFENIVSNPPFGLCDDRKAGTHPLVDKCLAKARRKVALLLPAGWVQGEKRSRWLEKTPLRRVYFIAPRPSMPPGHIVADGKKPGNGTTDYAWLVWQIDYDGPAEIRWLRRTA